MRTPVVLVLAAGLLMAADKPKEEAARKEVRRFQGTWRFARIEMGGQRMPEDALKGSRLVIKGNRFTLTEGRQTAAAGTFRVDPTRKPKAIDVEFTQGPDKGKVSRGIYELDGDTYKVCIGLAGKPRPTRFAAPKGTGHVLELLKRVKP